MESSGCLDIFRALTSFLLFWDCCASVRFLLEKQSSPGKAPQSWLCRAKSRGALGRLAALPLRVLSPFLLRTQEPSWAHWSGAGVSYRRAWAFWRGPQQPPYPCDGLMYIRPSSTFSRDRIFSHHRGSLNIARSKTAMSRSLEPGNM